jgi:opacity protein-like surface antigen
MRILIPAVILAAALAAAPPAAAQTTGSSSSTQKTPSKPPKPKKPPVPRKPIGARAFFIVDAEFMSASQSFSATTGSSTMIGFGGGGEILNVWKSIFARVAFSTASKSGEFGHVVSGEFISTGFPVDFGVNTFELGAGWRTYLKKHPKIALYGGGGLLFVGYSETNSFEPSLNVSERFTGYSAQGGLEYALSKWLTAGVEGQYRGVPDALGEFAVSKAYGESDLGGLAIRGMVGVRFKK